MRLQQRRQDEGGQDVAEWISDGHQRHPELARAIVGEFRRGGVDRREHSADAEPGPEAPGREPFAVFGMRATVHAHGHDHEEDQDGATSPI
jgi:hypothetical protein